ncbi:uncharacterized protein LOC141724374 [Apium graveolens]|uniref:uncharacterized protein LOC141724374 n=1 Tax=Apium graveolens TaxID=4045 RepID=UPI003D7BAE45
MAPKKKLPNSPSSTNSSDSETEHSSSSGDSDLSKPRQLTQSKPQQLIPNHESQDSSDSDADSESDSESDKTQKPLSPHPKKPVSKANGKRPAEIDPIDKAIKSKKIKGVEKVDKGSKSVEKVDKGLKSVEKVDKGKGSKSVEKVDKGSKKSKVSNGEVEGGEIEDKKGNIFARLFTEKDEIVLLEGMINYKEKNKGADPSLNIVKFHESVQDLLSCSVTKSQIADKIRRLKKKYVNYLKKGKNGEDPVISRPHEYKSFELSKKIWPSEGLGSEVTGDSKVKRSSRKKDDNVGGKTPLSSVGRESDFEEEVLGTSEVEKDNCWLMYPLLCASLEAEAVKNFTGPMSPKEYVKKVVSRLTKEKAIELEQGWKDFTVMEHQAYAKKVMLRSNQAEAVMNVIQH